MKQVNKQVLSGSNANTVIGDQLDCNQWVNASFHLVIGDATAAGALVVEASNDVCPVGPGLGQNFTVTNWVQLSSTTQTAGTLQISVPLANMAYRWIRVRWVKSVAGNTTAVVNVFAMSA